MPSFFASAAPMTRQWSPVVRASLACDATQPGWQMFGGVAANSRAVFTASASMSPRRSPAQRTSEHSEVRASRPSFGGASDAVPRWVVNLQLDSPTPSANACPISSPNRCRPAWCDGSRWPPRCLRVVRVQSGHELRRPEWNPSWPRTSHRVRQPAPNRRPQKLPAWPENPRTSGPRDRAADRIIELLQGGGPALSGLEDTDDQGRAAGGSGADGAKHARLRWTEDREMEK